MRRGEVWFINLDPTIGAELKKTRPAVIVNDDAVGLLPLKVIVPLTAWKEHYRQAPGWCVSIRILRTAWTNPQPPMPSRCALSPRSGWCGAWARSPLPR